MTVFVFITDGSTRAIRQSWEEGNKLFENYRYRDELFPTSRFRMAWDALREAAPQRANKRYLELLEAAAKEGEARVDEALRHLLAQGEISEVTLSADAVRSLIRRHDSVEPATHIAVAEVSLRPAANERARSV